MQIYLLMFTPWHKDKDGQQANHEAAFTVLPQFGEGFMPYWTITREADHKRSEHENTVHILINMLSRKPC